MIKFYYSGAPNPMKVALMLEETGLPYEAIPVDTRKGEQHKPEYLAINPNAKVPAIVDGDATVFDSNAILLYLAEKTGKFLPPKGDKARGELLSWLMFVASGVGPFSGQSVHFRNYAPEKIEYAINRYMYETQRHYAILDARLGQAEIRARRHLHHRRHGGVGLGAAHSERARRRTLGQVPQSEAAGRRDFRPAGGGARERAQGQAQVQDRVRRGSEEGHVRAYEREGGLMNAVEQQPKTGGRRRPPRTPKGRQIDPAALDEVRALLTDRPRRRDLLIEHLHLIQDRYGHLSAAHLAALAAEMKLAQTEVYEVATFYSHFDVVKDGPPPPAITVRVCDSLSCAMAGAEKLLKKLPAILGKDVRVVRAPCMGACDRAPVAAVGHLQTFQATPTKLPPT